VVESLEVVLATGEINVLEVAELAVVFVTELIPEILLEREIDRVATMLGLAMGCSVTPGNVSAGIVGSGVVLDVIVASPKAPPTDLEAEELGT
jgi:hypothetical protein